MSGLGFAVNASTNADQDLKPRSSEKKKRITYKYSIMNITACECSLLHVYNAEITSAFFLPFIVMFLLYYNKQIPN